MENCLETKLKSEIQNSNLLKVGEIRAELMVYGNLVIICGDSPNILDITILDPDITITNLRAGDNTLVSSTNVLIGDNDGSMTNGFFINTDSKSSIKVSIKNYYNIKYTDFKDIQSGINSLKWMTNLTQFTFINRNINIELSYLENMSNVKNIEVYCNNLSGYIGYVVKRELTSLTLSCYNDTVFGTVNYFNTCTKLTILNLADVKGVSGSIDDIANAQKSLRQTGDTITFTGNGVITFKANGDGTGADTVIAKDATKTITFDGQGGYSIA